MLLKMTVAVVAMGLCTVSSQAQMNTDTPAKTAARANTPAKSLDELLNMFEGEAIGVAKAMPAEKYGFAPNAAIFATAQPTKFETVRTFAEQVAHLAEANYYFYSSLSGLKPDVDMEKIGKLTTKDELVSALAASFVFAHKAVGTITSENAFLPIKPVDGMDTRMSLAAFGVAHGYDHYGQMVEYLRMNGIVPPGSK
jgi:uncharacterized damage-inducible protein DinB